MRIDLSYFEFIFSHLYRLMFKKEQHNKIHKSFFERDRLDLLVL